MTLGVREGDHFLVESISLSVSLLETIDIFLLPRGCSFRDVRRLGILEGDASFTATRLTMLLAGMSAVFNGLRIASLPKDFFEQTSHEQVTCFDQAEFRDHAELLYRAPPTITQPKKV